MERFTILASLIAAIAIASTGAAADEQKKTFVLASQRRPGDTERIHVTYEVGGTLAVPSKEKPAKVPLKVDATIEYRDRLLSAPDGDALVTAGSKRRRRSIRQYDRVQAKLVINEDQIRPELRTDRKLIFVQVDGATCELSSPMGLLFREELDLVQLPGDRLVIENLLPDVPVAVGSTWELAPEVARLLLGLDAVGQSDLSSKFVELQGRFAKIETNGTVHGATDGVATEVEIKARIHFDTIARRIATFQMVMRELREIGHVTPGIEAVAKLKMQITPAPTREDFGNANLSGLIDGTQPTRFDLRFNHAAGKFSHEHDRNWYATSENQAEAIFRRIDRGELIAQCKITALDDLANGESGSLEDYQQDVRKAIGDKFDRIVEASRTTDERAERTIFRVDVAGQVSDLQILWRYYLLTYESGRRISVVFTMEDELAERFGDADRLIIDSLELPPRDDPEVRTPTKIGS